jgi:membrane protein
MAQGKPTALASLRTRVRSFLDADPSDLREKHRFLRCLHVVWIFLQQVVLGFYDNRGPLRAAALCYTTLLALIPVLAVVFSFSKSFLRESSASAAPKIIDTLVASIAPQLEVLPTAGATNTAIKAGQLKITDEGRRQVVDTIQQFIGNIDAGALGAIGTVALIIVAIRLLMTIEQTFNDVWGVSKGRSIWRKVVYYWAAVTLGPLVLLTAVTMTGSAEFAQTLNQVHLFPGLVTFLLHLAPYALLWIGFSAMYGLMPNTDVRWWAATAGGVVGGTLWQLNSLLNTMYLSRVVTYSKIYGSLGIIPIFLIGLYFSWLIVLFGAQVSYAIQNHRSYLQQRAASRLDQLGRERLACRIVFYVVRQFLDNEPPLTADELATQLNMPPLLINQLVRRLVTARILIETNSDVLRVQPARLPETISIADVLHALRADTTKKEPADSDLVADLLREIHAAERASSSNLRFSDLVRRGNPAAPANGATPA